MAATTMKTSLDRAAELALARTGMVCLAAGMARCWRCSALMHEAVLNSEVVYRCRDSHFLTRTSVDEAVWKYYVIHAGIPIEKAIVNATQRRQRVQRAFSAIVLDIEHDAHSARRLIKAAYPRLAF